MFGGEASPAWVIDAVQSGKVSEERLDVSIRRILKDKFRLGLFDNPYVNADDFSIFENKLFQQKGEEAQRKSLVLLKNEEQILPLQKGVKLFVEGIDKTVVEQFANLVTTPSEADYIILKTTTPYDPRSTYLLERFFHQGRLHFTEAEQSKYLKPVSYTHLTLPTKRIV